MECYSGMLSISLNITLNPSLTKTPPNPQQTWTIDQWFFIKIFIKSTFVNVHFIINIFRYSFHKINIAYICVYSRSKISTLRLLPLSICHLKILITSRVTTLFRIYFLLLTLHADDINLRFTRGNSKGISTH